MAISFLGNYYVDIVRSDAIISIPLLEVSYER